ncbi:hypothetical protein [Kocuria rhizophila]|uniref:hypothetical protein n=1 Tax=Kocuria rhizophila TaxID=72000 RepID=UPI003D6FB132
MTLLLVKIFLAPLIILIASLLARRLGPQKGGFFIGLPTTSLPFMLVIWLGSGTEAAATAARGGLSGQITCALFCVFYARTARRGGPLTSMLAALAMAAALGFPTLWLPSTVALVAVAVVMAVAGLVTWPAPRTSLEPGRERRSDIPVRMLMACLTVVVMSGIEPFVGSSLAGALASLPTILMVMCPAVHLADGPEHAISLTRGTLGSIPGTAAYLCAVALASGTLGLGWAVLMGLAALPVVNAAVARSAALISRRRTAPSPARRRPLRRSGSSAAVEPLTTPQDSGATSPCGAR